MKCPSLQTVKHVFYQTSQNVNTKNTDTTFKTHLSICVVISVCVFFELQSVLDMQFVRHVWASVLQRPAALFLCFGHFHTSTELFKFRHFYLVILVVAPKIRLEVKEVKILLLLWCQVETLPHF